MCTVHNSSQIYNTPGLNSTTQLANYCTYPNTIQKFFS